MNTTIRPRGAAGFTLIELLVVMAIIATLAGLGMVGIPRILRQADITQAKSNLGEIYKVRHRLLDEVRVIKVLRPQLSTEEDLRTRPGSAPSAGLSRLDRTPRAGPSRPM